MDRREAIKKLAAGGAITAGASAVLSSTNVAYASSGTAPAGTIQTNGVSGNLWTVELQLLPTTWIEDSRTWSFTVIALGGNSSVSSGATSATNFQLSKFNNGGQPTAWKPGDQVRFSVDVVFDCGPASYGPTTLSI